MTTAFFPRYLSPGTLGLALCLAGVLLRAAPSFADPTAPFADFPVRSIRIIVASSPGTASDLFARSVGEDLGAFYRQSVIVDNRAGAGGLIGNTLVSRATADGHTLGMVDVTRIITELVRVWGTVSIIAIHSEPVAVNLYPMFGRELKMHGSRLYTRGAWEESIRLVSSGAINVAPLVTRRIPLEDLQKGMEEALGGGPVMKVLVDLSK